MNPIEYGGMANFYTYEAWQMITDPTSNAYQLKADAGQNFNGEGYGIVGSRYVIACTEYYGEIGDYIDWTLASGEILPTVIGDFKSSLDPNNNGWGHVSGNNLNVIEFIVDYDTWYTGSAPSFPSEWAGQLQGYEKVGNYWRDGEDIATNNLCTITGTRYVNGRSRNVVYVGSIQGDGYVYFNDDVMWRCYYDGTNLQRFYFNKTIWIRSDEITNIRVKGMSTSGGTDLPPGGSGVESAVTWAITIANDDSHGYDQPTRDGGVDFDCSSLTSWSFRQNGFDIPWPSPATYTMLSPFQNAGFTWYPGLGNDSSQLYRGDILLNIERHVAIYIGGGQLVEACINEFGGISGGQPGDQTGQEIRVGGFYSFPWNGVLRYEG